MLYRIASLRQAGMLDEKLSAYYEDTELGVRLGRRGWENRMSLAPEPCICATAQASLTDRSIISI